VPTAGAFATNMAEIAKAIKEMEKAEATKMRKAIRSAVAEAGKDTTTAIQGSARGNGLERAAKATRMTVSFSSRGAGAKVVTSRRVAPYARPLEFGSKNNGAFNRHPVFGSMTFRPMRQGQRRATAIVNQPIRPYFFKSVTARTKANEQILADAVAEVWRAVGFKG
jgi:hypothetical protein